jgi:methylisocitrate lyase
MAGKEHPMTTLREMIDRPGLTVAPLVLDPLSARLAEAAGFSALYLGGGALGYLKTVTEANLNLTEMAQLGMEIGSVSRLPLVLDGACGWGEPMHQHRTIAMTEAAGFAGIEIEDQIIPKRAHHHVGIEHLIPAELMVAKIAEAAAARRNPDFVIIGRTNAGRHDLDEALRRGEAMRKAGADMLLLFTAGSEHMRRAGERLGPPLMHLMRPGTGFAEQGMSTDDMVGLGYRLLVDSLSPVIVTHDALEACYARIKTGRGDPDKGLPRLDAIHASIGLDKLLDVERRTVEGRET